ncbi:hypothetical protein Ahy_B05g073858 [Arachis hypogaea]|uniref:Uncharacterized protein n=1 Tax=Arachis hypogaea TaxID=3818 RepID=A0A444YX73_ARAHY|nr:hypothetical protein Ahy_B05g073858 [Arachis hypogaea]
MSSSLPHQASRSMFSSLRSFEILWFRCGNPFDAVGSVDGTPLLNQSAKSVIEKIRRRELLLRYGAGLVLAGEEPCLDALSVVGDAGGDEILTLSKRLELQPLSKSERRGFLMSFFHICRDPRWGRCYESYSEDPKIVKKTMSSEDCLGWAARDASGHLSPYKFNRRFSNNIVRTNEKERNERLFYKLLIDNMEELLLVVYTHLLLQPRFLITQPLCIWIPPILRQFK